MVLFSSCRRSAALLSVLKQVNRLGLPRLSVELLDEPPATTPSGAGEFVGEMSVLNGDGLRMAALVSTSTPPASPHRARSAHPRGTL